MASREQMEQLLAELRRQREETEAEAGHAAETLADAVGRLKMLEEFARSVRRLLI